MTQEKNKSDEKTLLQRLGWMLYDDINRRLNIMIEECAHLQQLVHFYGDFDLPSNKEEEKKEEDQAKTKKKYQEHFKENDNDAYSKLNPTQRAMTALYDHLGGLVLGLESCREQIKLRFEVFIKMQKGYEQPWFWFSALRAFILHDVLEVYMRNLEHAHEKLIQILETKPGALPQPILLRRWNSALHGKFLSDYSRHIEWETSCLLNRLKAKPLKTDSDFFETSEFTTSRRRTSFIHSWAHTPTSRVDTFKNREKGKSYQLGSVRSAFFYLEVPLLYPLLYHECIHLQFDWMSDSFDEGKNQFFSRRVKVADCLNEASSAKTGKEDKMFWDSFTEEVWVDAISIALGGTPYHLALTLQFFGLTSAKFFYCDKSIPLEEWGIQQIYDIESVESNELYFWDARLQLANTSLAMLNGQEEDRWMEAVKIGIETYHKGGGQAFKAELTSREHASLWQNKKEINNWVFTSVRDDLEICCNTLKQTIGKEPLSRKYMVSANLMKEVIQPIISIHKRKYFDVEVKPIPEQPETSIVQLLYDLRWCLSDEVIKKMGEGNFTDEICEKFIVGYADYVRSDGSGAFRIAEEWIIARIELNLAFADYIENPELIEKHFEWISNATLKAKLEDGGINKDDTKKLLKYLRYHRAYNRKDLDGDSFKNDLKEIKEEIEREIKIFLKEKVVKSLAKVHAQEKGDKPSGARIGTYTLGTFSALSLRNKEHESPFLGAALEVCDYYDNVNKGVNASLPELCKNDDNYKRKTFALNDKETSLYFLAGDYDFAHYQRKVTPSERNFHPKHSPAMLTKSRVLLYLMLPDDNQPRNEWGRTSLIKCRYRWEVYLLREELISAGKRATLSLSSAWEDAVITTWYKNPEEMLSQKWGKAMNNIVDAQSNLILFKINEKGLAVSADANRDEVFASAPEVSTENKNLIDYLSSRNKNEVSFIFGRSDFTTQWREAKTPADMANILLKMPQEFWCQVSQIRTYFKVTVNENGDPLLDDAGFFSNVTRELFEKG